MEANIAFYRNINYDGPYHGTQSLHCYILVFNMLDNTKRICVFLPLCVYGKVILTQLLYKLKFISVRKSLCTNKTKPCPSKKRNNDNRSNIHILNQKKVS